MNALSGSSTAAHPPTKAAGGGGGARGPGASTMPRALPARDRRAQLQHTLGAPTVARLSEGRALPQSATKRADWERARKEGAEKIEDTKASGEGVE